MTDIPSLQDKARALRTLAEAAHTEGKWNYAFRSWGAGETPALETFHAAIHPKDLYIILTAFITLSEREDVAIEALGRIDSINDSPARFNSEINDVIKSVNLPRN